MKKDLITANVFSKYLRNKIIFESLAVFYPVRKPHCLSASGRLATGIKMNSFLSEHGV